MINMPIRTLVFSVAAVALAAGVALAQEKRIEFKDGPGLQQLQANCASCHSLDYIILNSPFLDRAGWDAEVKKMVNAYGAPINAADQAAIIEYLATNYGKQP